MRIALITANVGGMDEIKSPCDQNIKYEYFYYSEHNLPFPLPHLNNRLKARYIKTQAHKFLTHDVFIWIDGRIEVTSRNFISWMLEELNNMDIVMPTHPDRTNVYEEIEYIQGKIKEKSPYLTDRYKDEPFEEELDLFHVHELPVKYPLYACGVFARWNNKKVNKSFDDWWEKSIQFSNFDQGMFSYTAWQNKLEIATMSLYNDLYVVGKHK